MSDTAAGSPSDRRMAQTGDALFSQGQFARALSCFLAAQSAQPNVPEYAHRVGLALWRLGQHNAAREQYERALKWKPDYAAAHGELGRVLLAMGEIAPAVRHATLAAKLEPDNTDLAIVLASVLEADRKTDAARAIVERLLAQGVKSTDLAMVQSRLALRGGGEAHALEAIQALLGKTPPPPAAERSALHFSAANLLDRLGQYEPAFVHATKANALRGAQYDPIQTERSIDDFIRYFTPARLDRFARATTEVPVFIVGMPRSGTSLVEQILASHPSVYGAGELDSIARLFETAANRGAGGQTPTLQSLDNLSASQISELASEYLRPLVALSPKAFRITDKMPTNFIYLGFIAMLFPGARVIHCQRNPMDTCLSCYMTDFAAGHDFSFNLGWLGHFFQQYRRMIMHWKSVPALRILDVSYEDFVEDVEAQTRTTLEFLQLPWDGRCLQFYENPRFVGTASNQQVRRPVYRSSIGRWRNYARQLAPLGQSLGNA